MGKIVLIAVGVVAIVGGGFLAIAGSPPRKTVPPPEAIGRWVGRAKLGMTFTRQESLDVALDIAPDGRVSGTIGDATLREGSFKSNRNAIHRRLGWRTDWIVQGALDGPLVAAENLSRDGVNVPLTSSTASCGEPSTRRAGTSARGIIWSFRHRTCASGKSGTTFPARTRARHPTRWDGHSCPSTSAPDQP